MYSKYNPATPNRTGGREMAQTAAPRTPRMIKTPVPRMRSSAVRLPTPRTALREDLDRFIPSRRRMNLDMCRRKLNSASKPRESSSVACSGAAADVRVAQLAYKKELLSTLCNVPTSALDDDLQLKSMLQYGNVSPLKTVNRRPVVAADPFAMDFLRSSSSSTTGFRQKITVAKRVFNSFPERKCKGLGLVNDYYTQPLSWSKDNVLAVALGTSVFVKNESNDAVQELKDVGITPHDLNRTTNYVRSVKWCTMDGLTHLLAVGTSTGFVRVYDTISNKEVIRTALRSSGIGNAVQAMSWNDSTQWLTAGYTNGKIASFDMRSCSETGMTQHESAASSVCNLTWNGEGTCLASGRNDNVIHLWDASMMRSVETGRGPRLVLKSHTAAVKGLAWCPYRRNMLASGGGKADRCIKLWDACSGSVLSSVNTGSPVSSLVWGQHHQELYSGHGSSSNTVVAWSYPKMEKIQTFSNHHKGRILAIDMSPDGCKLASVGADQALYFWKVDAVPTRRGGGMFDSPSFGARFTIR